MAEKNSFGAASTLNVGGRRYRLYSLSALEKAGFPGVNRLPYSLKILLENLLRHEDGRSVTAAHIEQLARWSGRAEPVEISFMPARVLLQDFTGVPCVVDFAAMRDALKAMGRDPRLANPLIPADLVIDHSVQVDYYGSPDAFRLNSQLEYERNRERYAFLRWGQSAFKNLRVVPPDTGIIHQVNLEYLASVVFTAERDGELCAYPDTLVGTDSHTTMINSLGVLGWGVGGIEAEACMLGQPISMLIPEVVGFRLYGSLAPGATPTDVVLTVTQMLRKKGVVGKFVEFYGPGLDNLEAADRAVISNMAPEYGATMGGRGDDPILTTDGPSSGADRVSGSVHARAGFVPHRGRAGAGLQRYAGTGPGRRRSFDGWAAPPAGPHQPAGCEEELSRRVGSAAARNRHPVKRYADHPARGIGRHRGDHKLHEHFESLGDDRGGAAGSKSRGARAAYEALGQDQSLAGFQSGDGVFKRCGSGARAGSSGLPSDRIRLHDVHRQQRPAA